MNNESIYCRKKVKVWIFSPLPVVIKLCFHYTKKEKLCITHFPLFILEPHLNFFRTHTLTLIRGRHTEAMFLNVDIYKFMLVHALVTHLPQTQQCLHSTYLR